MYPNYQQVYTQSPFITYPAQGQYIQKYAQPFQQTIRAPLFNASQPSTPSQKYSSNNLNNFNYSQIIEHNYLDEQASRNKRSASKGENSFSNIRTVSSQSIQINSKNNENDKDLKIIKLQKQLNEEKIKFLEQKKDYENQILQQEFYIKSLLDQIEDLTKNQSLLKSQIKPDSTKKISVQNYISPQKATQIEQQPQTIYDKIGGAEAIDMVVDKFYEKMLADKRVKDFFYRVDMNKQRQSQKLFISQVLGGPQNYHGKNMKDAHAHLATTNQHFDITCEHLISTLQEFGVQQKEIQAIQQILETTRKDCVNVQDKKLISPQKITLDQTIFERIGGQQAVNLAVDRFYDKVLKDARVKDVFQRTDMKKQRQMQKDFITTVLGGPQVYQGKDMKKAHQHLIISNEQFDAICELLIGTLLELGVKKRERDEIGALLEPLRADCVTTNKIITLYDRIGGEQAVDVAVDIFYDKILKNQQLQTFFGKTDMVKQRLQQKKFITTVLGGKNIYDGKNMKDAHSHLPIQDEDFNLICDLLVETLQQLGIQSQELNEIQYILESTRKDIVSISKPTIFERLGGQASINLAVDLFYDKVLKDTRVNKFFNKTNMKNQRQKQKDFLTTVFGGPQVYQGADMRTAHAHLQITDVEFNAIVELLITTLQELGVDMETINDIQILVETLRYETLNK